MNFHQRRMERRRLIMKRERVVFMGIEAIARYAWRSVLVLALELP